MTTTQHKPRVAVDIGSTVVKMARLADDDSVSEQIFVPRDFDAGIAAQVSELLRGVEHHNVIMCSSANGGLRVGVLCLSEPFSGAALRNQVLLAGANPVFVRAFDDPPQSKTRVDLLVIGGGIDCEDAQPLRDRLRALDLSAYEYGAVVYAGNRFAAEELRPCTVPIHCVENPLHSDVRSQCNSVFEAIRDAYLDDLVHKDGIADLPVSLTRRIRPTPEVVNRGFQRVISNRSSIVVPGAAVVMDIGGATTDLHYTVEIVRDDSEDRPNPGASVARYVFTDLGIVVSADSTLMQMRSHPRIYEFLSVVLGRDVRETYRALREGELTADPELLAYGCLFLAFDRFGAGRGPGLPSVNLARIGHIILTGGAAQTLDIGIAAELLALFDGNEVVRPVLIRDNDYQLWVDGITFDV
ncbi:MAG: glutamate mutase L [Gammaproteobacteria bacterium]